VIRRSGSVISMATKSFSSGKPLCLPQSSENPVTISLLYVDDEPDLLSLGKIFLELSGDLLVDTAISAKTAITMMKSHNYSVIVSDYQMPEMNGIEFFAEVQRIDNNMPFILFTIREWEEVSSQALHDRRIFYLQKEGDARAQYTALDKIIKKAAVSS
jgi:DNA-binding NtrC family response regulator